MTERPHHSPTHADFAGITCRIRKPQSNAPHPTLIMLHGFQGTEDVTWIFARTLGAEWLVVSPRAPIRAELGYTWYTFDAQGHSDPQTFESALLTLERFIAALAAEYPIDPAHLILLGFSQGAAMAYAYAIHAARQRHNGTPIAFPPSGVISLGGFIPSPVKKPYPQMDRLPVLIIHGTEDETIRVAIARKNRLALEESGATVTYFEENVGHRVGSGGMRLLNRWMQDR